MTDAGHQMRQLIRIRQRRVDAADLERQRLAEQRQAQAARVDALQRQRSALSEQLAVLRRQRLDRPVRATDLQCHDQYQHRLNTRIENLDGDIDRERNTAADIDAALRQALKRWRQARASLDALERQWRRLQRQHRRRGDKKDEMMLDDLSVGRHPSAQGAESMNWQSTPRIDTAFDGPGTGRPQPQTPSREDRGRFEQLMDEVESRDPNTDQTREDEQHSDLPSAREGSNGHGDAESFDTRQADGERPLTQLNTPVAQSTAAQEIMAQTPPAPGTGQADFADLMARHVQQLLVSEPMSGKPNQEQQLLLRLSDQILPNTLVSLSRNAQGWTLKAQSSGRDSLDLIRKSSDKLVSRFNEAGLGDLNVETEWQDVQDR